MPFLYAERKGVHLSQVKATRSDSPFDIRYTEPELCVFHKWVFDRIVTDQMHEQCERSLPQ